MVHREHCIGLGEVGFDHAAFEVEDVDAVMTGHDHLAKAGYDDSTVPNEHPHRKRVYFHDPNGNDWEFVEYRSEDPAERNDYALPDAT